jgi:hypothetical protein
MKGMPSDDLEEGKGPRYIYEVKEEARKRMVKASGGVPFVGSDGR